MKLSKFCFHFDLRMGCLTYSWLQMMFTVAIITKVKVLHDVILMPVDKFVGFLDVEIFVLFIIAAIQTLKVFASIFLYIGLIKKIHMFYQPWLTVNAIENSILLIFSILLIINSGTFSSRDVLFFWSCVSAFTILSVFGWYIWACVYVVYKNDKKPGIIACNTFYENNISN